MNRIKSYLLVYILYILFYIFHVNAQILNKDEVLSIGINNCQGGKDCPKDSQGCIYNHCYYKYFCRNDECMSNTNSTLIYNKDAKVKGLIVDVCTQEAINNKNCKTPVCNKNTDCFSNSCINNVCMSNEAFPVVRCSNSYVQGIYIIKCRRKAYERCENDDDCFSGYCTTEKFCSDNSNKRKRNVIVLLYLLKLILGFTAIILIYIVIYKAVQFYKNKKEKSSQIIEEENEEEEMSSLTIKTLSEKTSNDSLKSSNRDNLKDILSQNKEIIQTNECDISTQLE